MIKEQTPRGDVDSEMGPTISGRHSFNEWLQVQLKARKLTQRQLAQRSGIDHSTISRLIRGDRVPSLRTATLLARGLGMRQDVGGLDDPSLGRGGSRAARVEYALRSDDLLNESEVREIMNVYLTTRLGRPRSVATRVPMETPRNTPVAIVIEVPRLRARSTSIGSPPKATRGLAK
jgi:transcriptional regulator with XRE-family HTH domain